MRKKIVLFLFLFCSIITSAQHKVTVSSPDRKLRFSASETFGFNDMKLSFRPVGNRQGYLYKTTETDTFRRKSICFGIKT